MLAGERIESPRSLASALAREAAHIAQKVPIDYCEARAHVFAPQLFAEPEFILPFKACVAASYLAVLADLVILVEQSLRPAAGARAGILAATLASTYADILAREPGPAIAEAARQGAVDDFAQRFAWAREQSGLGPAELATHCGRRMFQTLPLHRRLTAQDQDAIVATVQLRLVMFLDAFRRRSDASALVASLCAGRMTA